MEEKKLNFLVRQMKGEDGKQTVIVKKVSLGAKILEFILDLIYKTSRIFSWVVVCILITIGINTLLNSQMREQIVHMFYKMIGG